MSPRYNLDVDLLRESPTRSINRLVEKFKREDRDIIMLSAGEPGIPPPIEVRKWLSEALKEDSMRLYSYTPSPGFLSLREAVAEDLKDLGGLDLSPDQIVIASGGQATMFSTLAAVAEPGDEIIIIDPTYFGYWNLISYFKLRPVTVVASPEKSFQPDVEAVKEVVKKGRTKAMIIVNPDNPTGRVLRWDVAKALAEIAVDNDLWIIYDEPYKTLVYEGEHIFMYKLAPENVISLNSFSKDPGIPGWRLGYVYGPEWIIRKISLISEAITYNPPSVAQYLVLEYLRNRDIRRRHIEYVRRVFIERRDVMIEELSKIDHVEYVKPSGSMFIMIDLKEVLRPLGLKGGWFAEKLLNEMNVATVPGEFFGRSTENFIRLSFSTETPERIREGVRRIRELIEKILSKRT
ncbi:MAG: aminotransferase class I/II-fold pyridoxal phosphate-dependent enzyme [Desulfurococcales archaeon]|jgi:aspartate aminotransferase|nr:aminotransferase class I/II-fold pyridoxal phosphate-dependent enzyme [Desulfurococcales archaeon]